MKPLQTLFKIVLFLILIIGLGAGALWISGNKHVISAVQKSVLQGNFGPSIHDLDKFQFRTISPSKDHHDWVEQNTLLTLLPEETEIHKNLESENFLVIHNDTIISETHWMGHTVLSKTNSFSMAKSIVGTLCAIAVDEGKMKWNAPIGTYIKELRGKELGKITVEQLLGMNANTSWSESGANPFSDNAKGYYGTDLYKTITSVTTTPQAGKKFNYQSGNTSLAAYALTEAVETTLSDYATEKLWSKIGASYDAMWSTDDKNNLEKAFCCVYATGRDFANLGRLWLCKGTIDSTEIISYANFEKLITPAKVDFEPCEMESYGLTFWLENYKDLNIYYARGILGQYIIMIPQKDLIVVRLGNKRMKPNARCHPDDLYLYVDQALRLLKTNEERH